MTTKSQELRQPDSCLNKALPHEPIFVLRAHDPIAAQIIRLWAAAAEGVHEEGKIEEAYSIAKQFEHYANSQLAALGGSFPEPELNFPPPMDRGGTVEAYVSGRPKRHR